MSCFNDCPDCDSNLIKDCGCEHFDFTSWILRLVLNRCCSNKTTLWKIRMILGFFVNVIEFIVICDINSNNYLEGSTRKGLFGFIIVYIILVYSVLTCWAVENVSAINVRIYKVCDMIYDVFLVTYTYVIVTSVSDPFPILCVIFSAFDISFCILSIFCGNYNDVQRV